MMAKDDLGAKVVTKTQAWWEKLKEALEDELRACKQTAEFNEQALKIVENKLKEWDKV